MIEIILLITLFIKIYFIYHLYVSRGIFCSALAITFYFYFSNLYLYGKIKSYNIENIGQEAVLISLFLFITLIPYFIFLISKYKDKFKNKINRIIYFSISILIADILSSFLIGYILQRTSKAVIFDFSYMSPGYALTYTPFANFVNIYYVFGLTFIMAFVISICHEYKIKYSYIYLFLFASLFYFISKDDAQYNYIIKEKILVLPENNSITSKEYRNKIKENNYDYVLDNSATTDGKFNYIISTLYDKNENKLDSKIKYFLGPMGEYYPHKFRILQNIFNIDKYLTNNVEVESFESNNLINISNKKVLLLICADAWSYVSVERYNSIKKEIDYIMVQRDINTFNGIIFQEANMLLYKAVLSKYFNKPVVDIK